MNFGFTEEQELLRKIARDVLAERSSMAHVREIMESEATHSESLWKELAELGWLGLALPDTHGGEGLSAVELAIVAQELGRSLAPVPFLSTTIASAVLLELGDEAQQREWLPRIASGEVIATLAIAERTGNEELGSLALTAREEGGEWVLTGKKRFVPDAAAAGLLLAVARIEGGGIGCFTVPTGSAGLGISLMRSMDTLRPLYEVELDGARVGSHALLGSNRDAARALRPALDQALVTISAEMLGGAEQCLETAVQYTKDRVQFGKPIGVNQAIKHKCSNMLFEVESARSITYYAAWAVRERDAEAGLLAAMAKAYAGEAYRRVSEENLQIHGGVGYTWEYDCHLYLKRSRSDESWLGDAHHHRTRIAHLIAGG